MSIPECEEHSLPFIQKESGNALCAAHLRVTTNAQVTFLQKRLSIQTQHGEMIYNQLHIRLKLRSR